MTELLYLRTVNSRTHILEGGQFRTDTFMRPVHVPTDWTAWRRGRETAYGEVDPRLELVTGAYQPIRTFYTLQADPRRCTFAFASLDGDCAWLELESVNGRPPRSSPAIVSGNTLTWRNVARGVDVQVVAGTEGVEVFKRIRTPGRRRFVWRARADPGGLAWLSIAPQLVGWDNADGKKRKGERPRLPRNRKRELQILHKKTDPVDVGGFVEWREIETFSGQTYRIDPATRIKQLRPASETVYPAVIDPTITVNVSVNADNGNEHSATWFDIGEFSGGYYGAAWQPYYGRNVGMRFQNVTVPQGATVSSATIATQVRSLNGTTIVSGCAIFGDKVADAAAWSNSSLPSGITKTTASTALPTTLPGVGAISWDVTPIVQELVNQVAWASGKSQRFAWLGPTGGAQGRAFYGTKGNHYADVPVLSVTYSAGGTVFTVSVSENLALNDNAQRIASSFRAVNDSLGLSSAIARQANANRIAQDSTGTAEFFARQANGNRQTSDNLGVGDLFLRQANAFRSSIDSVGVQDLSSRQSDANRVFKENFAVSDTALRTVTSFRRVLDNLGLTDSAALLLVVPGAVSILVIDSLGMVEAFARQANAKRLLLDSLGSADLVALFLVTVPLALMLEFVLGATARLEFVLAAATRLEFPEGP